MKTAGAQVDIRLEDYREPRGKFGSIVSIEMFEAVGERYWKTYFDQLKAQLDIGGTAVIQTITIDDDYFDDYRLGSDAIRDCIFPGGLLPSERRFREEASRAGFRIADTYKFGRPKRLIVGSRHSGANGNRCGIWASTTGLSDFGGFIWLRVQGRSAAVVPT